MAGWSSPDAAMDDEICSPTMESKYVHRMLICRDDIFKDWAHGRCDTHDRRDIDTVVNMKMMTRDG
jgi:hypothetical protein